MIIILVDLLLRFIIFKGYLVEIRHKLSRRLNFLFQNINFIVTFFFRFIILVRILRFLNVYHRRQVLPAIE